MTRHSESRPELISSKPFSRPLKVDEITDEGLDRTIHADPAERVEIARDIGLPSIAALTASFHLARRPGGRFHVTGRIAATITQICVVSLEPFDSEIEQPVDVDFAPAPVPRGDRGDRARAEHPVSRRRRVAFPEAPVAPVAAVEEDDPPDPIFDGHIDLGAVAVEFLALGLDFYPKRPGAAFTETVVGQADAPEVSPFAALERLRDRS